MKHSRRASFRSGCPLHVTMRLVDGLPGMRRRATYVALLDAFGTGCERLGMRLVHWSVLGNHMHLLLEAASERSLSRGMQGLAVRMARALNRAWGRAGRVFADRYHARVLGSPREVRSALFYCLQNARKHHLAPVAADPYSSGPWFDGWLQGARAADALVGRPAWLLAARGWLLAHGWRRLGLLDVKARPAGP